jgi:pyruvate carboxylase
LRTDLPSGERRVSARLAAEFVQHPNCAGEAMKMEHALVALIDGKVADVRVSAGGQVAEGAPVMTIEAVSV